MTKEMVDCLKCEYFHVTWDPSFPRGCKLFGFKTSRLPSQLVRESTGAECTNFREKKKKAEK